MLQFNRETNICCEEELNIVSKCNFTDYILVIYRARQKSTFGRPSGNLHLTTLTTIAFCVTHNNHMISKSLNQ